MSITVDIKDKPKALPAMNKYDYKRYMEATCRDAGNKYRSALIQFEESTMIIHGYLPSTFTRNAALAQHQQMVDHLEAASLRIDKLLFQVQEEGVVDVRDAGEWCYLDLDNLYSPVRRIGQPIR